MRFVIYGAGAIGGVIGARLFEHRHDVSLIARGDHFRAIRDVGLRIESPEEAATLQIPVYEHPSEIEFRDGDIVLLAIKSQDTAAALRALALSAPAELPVACAQNGVENERAALRLFANVYGICVMCPASFLEPGVVQAHSTPTTGGLDLGRYPAGTDETAHSIAHAFEQSTFSSHPVADIMRWKYAKLLMNLGNAVEALTEPGPAQDALDKLAVEEGEACLRAAGIDFASREEDRVRREGLLRVLPVGGRERGGGSSWQSLARGAGSIEAEYLNGEIVMLGRIHGIATPANELLVRLATRAASERRPPATESAVELLQSIAA